MITRGHEEGSVLGENQTKNYKIKNHQGLSARVKKINKWVQNKLKSAFGDDKKKHNSSASGTGADGKSKAAANAIKTAVEIFVTEDSFLSSNEFFMKIDTILRDESSLKIIVFDDLPCWKDTERRSFGGLVFVVCGIFCKEYGIETSSPSLDNILTYP